MKHEKLIVLLMSSGLAMTTLWIWACSGEISISAPDSTLPRVADGLLPGNANPLTDVSGSGQPDDTRPFPSASTPATPATPGNPAGNPATVPPSSGEGTQTPNPGSNGDDTVVRPNNPDTTPGTGQNPPASNPGTPGNGENPGTPPGTPPGSTPPGSTPPSTPPSCQEINLEIGGQRQEPNVMLAVDKSGSMSWSIQAFGQRTKIDDTKTAIQSLLGAAQGKIRFGWMQFPSPQGCTPSIIPAINTCTSQQNCTPGQVEVECGNDQSTMNQIQTRMAALVPGGGTPTGPSLENLLQSRTLNDPARDNFVILLTDGVPTCPNGSGANPNNGDNQLALGAIAKLTGKQIKTFVIGIGEDLNNTNPAVLSQMAVSGGSARDGATRYYPANSLAELQSTLNSIGRIVIGCQQQLPLAPAPSAPVRVLQDGREISRSPEHNNGFDIAPNTRQLDFYGPACDELQNGKVQQVKIIIGC